MKLAKKLIKKIFSPNYQMLNARALGLAGGIISGACVLLMTLATYFWGLFPSYTGILIDIYGLLAYSVTPGGALLGAIYSFIDGFIVLYVLAWMYNKFL